MNETSHDCESFKSGNAYHVSLDVFEGPLDLLLHLIKQEKVDIYDIPLSRITDQYISYLDAMQTLCLNVAGEFLLMASTLAHLKSGMLLPPCEDSLDPEEEGLDPRKELVRRLLEYQKYKNAAEQLLEGPILYRDVFRRERIVSPLPRQETKPELVEISIFRLVEAFHKVLENLRLDEPHHMSAEVLRVADCAQMIARRITESGEGSLRFSDLFEGMPVTRARVVTTFIALLELLRRGLVRVFQAEAFSEIQVLGTASIYGDWNDDGFDDT